MTEGAVSRIARNTGVQVGGEVVSKIASLAFYVVMARVLEPAGFGAFTFALSLALLLTVFADLGIDTILTREIARSRDRVHRLFWNAIAIRMAGGMAAIAVGLTIVYLGGYGQQTRLAVGLLIVAVLLELFAKTLHGAFRGYEDMAPIALGLILQRIFTAVAGVAAILAGAGVALVALIYLVGAALALIYCALALVRRHERPRVEASYLGAKDLAYIALPIGIAEVFYMVLFRIDATLLSLMKDEAAVGIYSAAYRLLESTLFLTYAFVWSVVPLLSRLSRTSKPAIGDVYLRAAKVLAVALLPLGAMFALFADPIVHTLYGHRYDEAEHVLRILSVVVAVYGLSYLAAYLLVAQDRQRVVPVVIGAVTVLNVVLNLLLIPKYSYDAAAFTTSLSELIAAVVLTILASRATGRVPGLRVVVGPLAGCAAMGAVALAAGTGIAGMLLSIPAYCVVLLFVERMLFPADIEMIVSALRKRRLV